MQAKTDFDVGIIGGGPAGAAMAGYLAKAGVSCCVFERELFPRPHVGESLVPSTTRVFRDLDFLDQMEEHKFPHKHGAVWSAGDHLPLYDVEWDGLSSDCEAAIRFDERQQEGVDKNYTYHVDRGKFDMLFLQHAHWLGAEVYEGVQVREVHFGSNGDPALVKFKLGEQEIGTRVKMVVDCSGRQSLLGKQLGLRIKDPVFDQFAIHAWFDGYDRGSDRPDYIWIHFLPITNTWIWQIPITDTVTSIGVVTQKRFFEGKKSKREDFFWNCVGSRPGFHDKLRAAEQVRPFTVEADYSYGMKQICGDRFALVGDAARFVDPIFSSGVSIALSGARFLAPEIIAAVEKNDFRKASFAKFERTMRFGTKNWYEFISVYYRLNVLFTYFITDSKYRTDVLKLLQGDVYDEAEPEVLGKMRSIVSQVEQNPGHVWHNLLNDLTSHAFKPQF
jgi:FADH2 O2-dependent halogenase